jgi:hypothetical protein
VVVERSVTMPEALFNSVGFSFGHFFLRIMSGAVLLHRQRSPQDLLELLT